jgi:CBS domain-containing protein
MQVADAMTRDVKMVNPGQSIADAARMMADSDIGSLPVAENDRLVGMVTDRDIVVRGIARGKAPDTTIKEVMSTDIKYCFEDNDLDDVARNMGDLQIRRLPVVNRDKRLVGIVALGDLAETDEPAAGEALTQISEAASQHQRTGQRPH